MPEPPTVRSGTGLLQGKRLLITGVLTDASLAFAVARKAQAEGAEIALSGAGRGLSLTRRTARKLEGEVPVLAMDVTDPDQIRAAAAELGDRWDRLDGLLHAIAYGPPECLGGDIFQANWEQASIALQVSAYSLKAVAEAFRSMLGAAGGGDGVGASVVGLDFDAGVAWPVYDWMGVAKAALESLTRYLARDLGAEKIRVNLVAAGPIRTIAATSIPGFSAFEDSWEGRAPLGWDVHDGDAVAGAVVALFSDLLPMTTGEILHVDGGAHAIGA